jgi:hypothetical protein
LAICHPVPLERRAPEYVREHPIPPRTRHRNLTVSDQRPQSIQTERTSSRQQPGLPAPRLAEAINPHYRALVLVGAFGGLRIGEMAGLRRARFDIFISALDAAHRAATKALDAATTDSGGSRWVTAGSRPSRPDPLYPPWQAKTGGR